jgi:hypothetical protein
MLANGKHVIIHLDCVLFHDLSNPESVTTQLALQMVLLTFLCKYGLRSRLSSFRISMRLMCKESTSAWTAPGVPPGVAVSARIRKCGFVAIM